MATLQAIQQITDSVKAVLQFRDGPSLVRRPEVWGEIDFDKASTDIEQAYAIAESLGNLPLQFLTDASSGQIASCLEQVIPTLKRIHDFRLGGGDPRSARDQLTDQLHNQVDNLMTIATPAIPYLLYRRGDIDTNIAQLNQAIKKTQALYSDGEAWVSNKKTAIEQVLDAARDVAASSGAAVFSNSFNAEADGRNEDAKSWLWTTAGLAVATLATAAVIYFCIPLEKDPVLAIQKTTTKLIILGALGTAAIWCGRIYRALKHQATLNKHRALSIQTLEAFRQSAAAPEVKDQVVLEATRAVFGAGSTGYMDATDQAPTGISILELTRSASKST